jgi:hypothetical protein
VAISPSIICNVVPLATSKPSMHCLLSQGLGDHLTRLRFHGAWELSEEEMHAVKAGCPGMRDFVNAGVVV